MDFNFVRFIENHYILNKAAVDSAPNAIFEPLWGFCNGGDGAVSGQELAGCGQKIGNFLGVSGGT